MEKQSFLEFSKDKKLDGLLLLTGKRKKFPVFSILLGQYVYGLVKEDILNHRYPYRNGEFHWYSLQTHTYVHVLCPKFTNHVMKKYIS